MISYYPPLLFPFLGITYHKLPSSLYFISWEDALWHLLDSHIVKPHASILLPDFYCLDVVENMRSHGLKVKFYPLGDDLQPQHTSFNKLLSVLKPDVIIIFHVAGLASNLALRSSWRKRVKPHTLILHDYVHSLNLPQLVDLPTPYDLAINSLRKNIPLSGSLLFAHPSMIARIKKPYTSHPSYLALTILLFSFYRLCLSLGYFLSSYWLVKFAHKQVLKAHDNLVGNSLRGNRGLPFSRFLVQFVNYDKVESFKAKQVKFYQSRLQLYGLTLLKITHPGLLHAYPLVIKGSYANKISHALSTINVWAKFEDSPWGSNRQVFFLPLGFHITLKDQNLIVETIRRTLLP